MDSVFAAVGGALVGSFTTYLLGLRAWRRQGRLQYRREVADTLLSRVQSLRTLSWHAACGHNLDPRDVAESANSFELAALNAEGALPQGAVHLRCSAREALANLFGPVGASGLLPQAAFRPLDVIDPYWADISLSWFAHTEDQLRKWRDSPAQRRLQIAPYHSWRRDEDPAFAAASRVPLHGRR
jgi:hypothetical protein